MRDTLSEYMRRSNFIRIYPSKNSDIYEFPRTKVINQTIFKIIFEILHFKCGWMCRDDL